MNQGRNHVTRPRDMISLLGRVLTLARYPPPPQNPTMVSFEIESLSGKGGHLVLAGAKPQGDARIPRRWEASCAAGRESRSPTTAGGGRRAKEPRPPCVPPSCGLIRGVWEDHFGRSGLHNQGGMQRPVAWAGGRRGGRWPGHGAGRESSGAPWWRRPGTPPPPPPPRPSVPVGSGAHEG